MVCDNGDGDGNASADAEVNGVGDLKVIVMIESVIKMIAVVDNVDDDRDHDSSNDGDGDDDDDNGLVMVMLKVKVMVIVVVMVTVVVMIMSEHFQILIRSQNSGRKGTLWMFHLTSHLFIYVDTNGVVVMMLTVWTRPTVRWTFARMAFH